VAGGGSFLTFPALLFTGMTPIAANATNTAGGWPGTVSSVIAYRNAFDAQARRLLPPLLVAGVIGGILGARILLGTPQDTFLHIIPWLLLGSTLLFVFSGRMAKWVLRRTGDGTATGSGKSSRALLITGLFLELLIAIYIGYFGAGSGILFLSLFPLQGMENINAMNAVKTLIVAVINGVAMITFIVARAVVWPQALVMVVAASIGGYAGAFYAQKANPQYIRVLVIVIGFSMALYFFIRY